MTAIAYHASHEQFSPMALRSLALRAERAGFDELACSDHLAPWSRRDAVCGNAWAWMNTVLAETSIPMNVVTAPGGRYPPLVLAQLIATTALLHPGRLRVAIGSGEALNEVPAAGGPWPDKPERDRRLRDAVERIDAWLRSSDPRLRHPSRETERLYLGPTEAPLTVAAVDARTAAWIGTWWNGLTTVADTVPATRERVDAFRQAAGARGHVTLKLQIAVAADAASAARAAQAEWGPALADPQLLAEGESPSVFETTAAGLEPGDVAARVRPVTSAAELEDVLSDYLSLDVDTIVVHDVCPGQEVLTLRATTRPPAA